MDGSGELNLLWKNAKILVALKGSINGTQHIHTTQMLVVILRNFARKKCE